MPAKIEHAHHLQLCSACFELQKPRAFVDEQWKAKNVQRWNQVPYLALLWCLMISFHAL